jgi:PAS domain S-box-containing protein
MQNTTPVPARDIDILVVEDSATQAQLLARLLAADGYRVRIAANGRDGLEAARASKPDLIVSDIAMPAMDGYELCRQIKQDPALRAIPVILLTSLTSLHDVVKGLDCGADSFLRKPFDSAYLLERVRAILADRAPRLDETAQPGMRVSLGGQTHFISAERQQIFDLLVSTYEEAIQMTEQLTVQQARIAHSYQSLEGLYKIAEALNPALSEQAVGELALERLLDFPGVLGACIKLSDGDGQLRLVAARHFRVDGGESAGAARCAARRAACDCDTETVARPHVCIPFATGAGTRGVLCLMTSGAAIADQQWQVLETVGNQIAIAIERARLFGHMEAQVKQRTEAWQAERKLLSAVVNTSGALVCMVDAAGVIRLFNPACEQVMGWPALEAIGRPCWEVFRRVSGSAALAQFFARPSGNSPPSQVHGEWLARDGSPRAIVWSTTVLRKDGDFSNGDGNDPDNGAIEFFLGTGVDVTQLRGAEEKLRYLSNYDPLTGLPNRILLRERAGKLQEQVAGAQVMGLLLLEPQRLRLIGESLGIEAEQAMVQQIAARLAQWTAGGARGAAGGGASVARIGERSFALVAVRNAAGELAALARQVLAVMNTPFSFEQQELHLDPCIGIALFPHDGDDFDSIAQGAEAAMRRAGDRKAERYEFYRPELNHGAQERFKFETALRHAVKRDELVLHYQPQLSLASGAIIGLEALVRWRHPELGLVAPGCFIPLAEETGLILPIGEWVLRRACEQSCAWQREGLAPVPVSVNLSARQFSADIAATVARILADTGLAPYLLELELTESASMEDPQQSFLILRQLKDMGVRLAIDDFGTGYSNLSYLKRFPVDKLKLDQSFVRDITTDADDLAIARAVIAMAHGLRLTVIAEGVETACQLALLMENGCDEIQGYFFSRPIDAAACARLLRDHVAQPGGAAFAKPAGPMPASTVAEAARTACTPANAAPRACGGA